MNRPVRERLAFRNGDGLAPGEVGPRQRDLASADLLRRPLEDDLAPVHARPRTDVDDLVGLHHHVLVVLHDEDRVPHVAQTLQGRDQADVVPLVEADGRLVEDVENADQPRPDLRGQPDPLALPAGEASRSPVQAQVVHADIEQKAEPQPDLLHHPLRHVEFLRGEWNRREKVQALPDRKAADLADVFPAYGHGQTFLLQACAQAGRALAEIDVTRQVHADGGRSFPCSAGRAG